MDRRGLEPLAVLVGTRRRIRVPARCFLEGPGE